MYDAVNVGPGNNQNNPRILYLLNPDDDVGAGALSPVIKTNNNSSNAPNSHTMVVASEVLYEPGLDTHNGAGVSAPEGCLGVDGTGTGTGTGNVVTVSKS